MWLNKFIDCREIFCNFVYWICLFSGIGGILFYICGFKKGGKVAKFSIVIYWVVVAVCCKN